jgi:hypothetical protein
VTVVDACSPEYSVSVSGSQTAVPVLAIDDRGGSDFRAVIGPSVVRAFAPIAIATIIRRTKLAIDVLFPRNQEIITHPFHIVVSAALRAEFRWIVEEFGAPLEGDLAVHTRPFGEF